MGKIVIIFVVVIVAILGTIMISINRRSEIVPEVLSSNFQDIGSYALQYGVNQVVTEMISNSITVDYVDPPFNVLDGQINSIEYEFVEIEDEVSVIIDPGLFGGHFDVDVFNKPTDKELYHEHEFDDKFNITYIDIANDPRLLFDIVIGDDYPNDLRLEFFNAEFSSGQYIFESGSDSLTGNAQDGFNIVFDPGSLVQLRVNFESLHDLRDSEPKTVQKDIANRDNAFSIRMYDTVSGNLEYELSTYHHVKMKHGVIVDEVFDDITMILPVGTEVIITANVTMLVNGKTMTHDSVGKLIYDYELIGGVTGKDDIETQIADIIKACNFKVVYWNP